ncbi:MAG: DUF4234 domain-containing protein [Acutalibacteraceae bacterium]|nr:DUF4234 domain-containing protein [Acutalibacteraceae bacterium]
MNNQTQMPVNQLDTNRGIVKFILFSIITLGVYSIITLSKVSTDINTIASRYDGKKTLHFCLILFLLTPITCGVAAFVWYHRLSNRIGAELQRRNIPTEFNASTFWIWNVLGCLIVVGPFIYAHKLLTAMNQLSQSYNTYG